MTGLSSERGLVIRSMTKNILTLKARLITSAGLGNLGLGLSPQQIKIFSTRKKVSSFLGKSLKFYKNITFFK